MGNDTRDGLAAPSYMATRSAERGWRRRWIPACVGMTFGSFPGVRGTGVRTMGFQARRVWRRRWIPACAAVTGGAGVASTPPGKKLIGANCCEKRSYDDSLSQ